jgi:polar amino acid transport system substrate-binding protein
MARSTGALLGLLLAAGCGLPRDPDGTLDRVRGGVVRIGVSESRPWVVLGSSGVGGVEAGLVRDWADGLRARVEWVQGSENELLQALERRELDLVITGLTADSPWSGQVGFTRAYFTETYRVGLPPGAEASPNWRGATVAFDPGRPLLAAYLRSAGADPLPAEKPAPGTPVAGPEWRLQKAGLSPVGKKLSTARHAIATAAGENALLLDLDRFLAAHESEVPARLAAAEGAP